MNHEADTLTPDVPTPETMGDLEAQVQSQLRGRVRDFRLSLREGGACPGGLYPHLLCEATGSARGHGSSRSANP